MRLEPSCRKCIEQRFFLCCVKSRVLDVEFGDFVVLLNWVSLACATYCFELEYAMTRRCGMHVAFDNVVASIHFTVGTDECYSGSQWLNTRSFADTGTDGFE